MVNEEDTAMVQYYEITDDTDVPTKLFRLTVDKIDVHEEVWNNGEWEVLADSVLVGWLVDGRVDLEEVDQSEAERFALADQSAVAKFNPNHDAHGRFAPGEGAGFVHDVRQPDGGFTFNPVTGASASSGYAVSPYPERSQVMDISKMSDKAIRSAVNAYGVKNKDIISKPGVFVGGWHDPENKGKVYLDISVVTKTAAAAERLALKHDQIAYFDFQTFQSVTVNKDAKSGQG
jgi:hypothetical protein